MMERLTPTIPVGFSLIGCDFLFGEELIDNMVEELLSERLDEKIKENEASLQNLFEHIKTTKEILPRAEFLDISKSFMIQWLSLIHI